MPGPPKYIFLADDDIDDRELFEDALREVCTETILTVARNGNELMSKLDKAVPAVPDLIFLDLNMPVKNGFECLAEIKAANTLKDIKIVIFSTSSEADSMNKVYEQGADFYICKPDSFPKLKHIISKVLSIDWDAHATQPSRDSFVLVF
jgi:CheY-like chemotaxis protein